MYKKFGFFLFLSLFFLHVPFTAYSSADTKEAKDEPTEKYKVIGNLEEAKSIRPIEVVKYFNYSCGHCYRFLKNESKLERLEVKINLKKVPVFWGKQTPFPAMAYYYALKQGKGVEINKAIFNAQFELELDVFNLPILNQILLEHGLPISINGKPWNRSSELRRQVEVGMKTANRLAVRETPTIVINEVIKVLPKHTKGDMAKMVERVEEAIFDLSH